jgi:hypothetical protein
MRDALMYIARGAEADGRGIQRDADMLEAAMAGAGTKDERLTWRIVRGHWNRPRFEAVKQAYQKTYGKSLKKRVEGETTGKFEVSSGQCHGGVTTTGAHRANTSGSIAFARRPHSVGSSFSLWALLLLVKKLRGNFGRYLAKNALRDALARRCCTLIPPVRYARFIISKYNVIITARLESMAAAVEILVMAEVNEVAKVEVRRLAKVVVMEMSRPPHPPHSHCPRSLQPIHQARSSSSPP